MVPGLKEPELKSSDMVDQDKITDTMLMLMDRLTPEELVEMLGLTTKEVFERFEEECMEVDWELVLD